jgi:hypothetical protein
VGSDPGAIVRYVAFALLAIVAPGAGVQRLLRVPVDPALVLPLGTAAAAGAWWVALVTGVPWVFFVLLAPLALGLLVPPGRVRLAVGPPLRPALPAMAVLVLVLAATQYPWNRLTDQGEFLLDPFLAFDTAFHAGLTHELTLGFPPHVPGVAGFPLGYHFGTDLVRAAALRWAAVHPYDSISRFDVTLWALGLVLALRAAAHGAGAGPRAVALVPWAVLATDFSFVFAANPQAHWWSDLLRGNVLISLAVSNPVVPAMSLALGALVALARHEAAPRERGWLVLAALQALAVPFFKVFLGAHLLLGLGLAMALGSRSRARGLAIVAAPCGLATALLVFGQGGQTLEVSLSPLDLVRITREGLGLAPKGELSLALWALLWLAASLGVRVLGLPQVVRSAREGPAAGQVLAWMALCAWPLGLLFRVSAPETLPGQKPFNDVYVLIEQGGLLLWIFTAMALARLTGAGLRSWAVLTVLGLLSFPSTVQFVWKKATAAPDPVPAGMVRAMDGLAAASRPGEVVMQRPGARYPPLPVVLIGRRVPYERFTPFLAQFAPAADLRRRHEMVFRFFRTADASEALGIARALEARYLCLYGPDRVRFETGDELIPLHEEAQARCYRLRSAGRPFHEEQAPLDR